MAHPGWPWVDETTAVALHKGNVYWEMSGWAPKYFPAELVQQANSLIPDRVLFGTDWPAEPMESTLDELPKNKLSPAVLHAMYRGNAERLLPKYKG